MIRIAIIGAIGSGKSHIAKLFRYPVFNADHEVAKLYKKSRECYVQLKKALPKHIISYPLEKSEILKAINDNKNNIKKITKIIHPKVRFRLRLFFKKNKKKKIVILDIPLLIENKINKKKDILVFVDAKQKEINKRLKKRSNINLNIIKKLQKLQFSVKLKKKKSHYIIKNNFNNSYVKKNVRKILKNILLNARSYT